MNGLPQGFWLWSPEKRAAWYRKNHPKPRVTPGFVILWLLGIAIPFGGTAALAYLVWPAIAPYAEKALGLIGR